MARMGYSSGLAGSLASPPAVWFVQADLLDGGRDAGSTGESPVAQVGLGVVGRGGRGGVGDVAAQRGCGGRACGSFGGERDRACSGDGEILGRGEGAEQGGEAGGGAARGGEQERACGAVVDCAVAGPP